MSTSRTPQQRVIQMSASSTRTTSIVGGNVATYAGAKGPGEAGSTR